VEEQQLLEADHSNPTNSEVKKECSCTYVTSNAFMTYTGVNSVSESSQLLGTVVRQHHKA
jgi:hypothetical protein